MPRQQRLIPRSLTSHPKPGQLNASSIDEGVRASVMDPLWFLSRQWQMKEFRAENCGSIASVKLKSETIPIDRVFHNTEPARNEQGIQADNNEPIEPLVESKIELNKGPNLDITYALEAPNSWECKNLEYQFSIGSSDKNVMLSAKEYFGERLDWYSFSITKNSDASFQKPIDNQVIPQPVRFPGMPKARWWQFEDANIDLGDIQRPNLNPLSILLTEFALLYSNDWFILPVQQLVGSLRKVDKLLVMDVFGNSPIDIQAHVCSPNNGSEDQSFTLFALTESKTDTRGYNADSSVLFLANTLAQYIQGDSLEEVIFSRDEMANLVWAIERRYFDGKMTQNREDEEAHPEVGPKNEQDLPQYKIMSPVRKNWVPYLSVQNSDKEQIYFRRGKTITDGSKQYETKIISDSTRIWEKEIPATPIVLTQNAKMVVYDAEKWSIAVRKKKEDGETLLILHKTGDPIRLIWIGRKKNHSIRQHSSNLKFDYLIE